MGSPENEEYILSFETIDKMRRVSSYSSLNSLIGNSYPSFGVAFLHMLALAFVEFGSYLLLDLTPTKFLITVEMLLLCLVRK